MSRTETAEQRTDRLAHRLGGLLEQSQRTIAVAESLTGGLLVQALARQRGSGDWLQGGVVAYHRSVKYDLLDVDEPKVVSESAAMQMASSVRRQLGGDIGLSVTGVAGPDPQDGEPPGTVWIAVDAGDRTVTRLLNVDSDDPEEICVAAVSEAIAAAIREIDATTIVEAEDAGRWHDASDNVSDDESVRTNFSLADHGLSIVCFGLFVVLLIAQSLTGWRSSLAETVEHGGASFGYWKYLASSHFAEATFENWESEFLQMGAFVLLTIFLVQKGSAESKPPGGDEVDEDPRSHRTDPDAPWPVRHGGLWLKLYENSLLIAFTLMFAGSLVGHALAGARELSAEQRLHGSPGLSTWQFVQGPDFWFQSFQNWQSEFLAVVSIVVLTIFLRQRGSAESKPVHAPHSATGE